MLDRSFIKINQTLGNNWHLLSRHSVRCVLCQWWGGGFFYKASLIGSNCKCVFAVFSSLHIWFCFSCLVLISIQSYFLSPPQFCHIYAFGLDALFALVLTQGKNCAACSLPFVFVSHSCCQTHFVQAPSLFACIFVLTFAE